MHSGLASKRVPWFSSDSKEQYLSNLKDTAKKKLLEEFGWSDTNVSYTFNSHGFRSDEFAEDTNSLMILGASIVIGTGVSDEQVWTKIVSDTLGMKNYNLGISGGSNDSSFRIGNHYIPLLMPKVVLFVNSYPWRMDVIQDDEFFTFINMDYHTPNKYKPFFKDWISHEENGELNYLKNKLGIMYLCSQHGSKFIEIDGHEIYTMSKHTLGRDLIHPGVLGHRTIANHVLDKIGDAG